MKCKLSIAMLTLLSMVSPSLAGSETPNADQKESIANMFTAKLAHNVCGHFLNGVKIESDFKKVGLSVYDLKEGGRFSDYFDTEWPAYQAHAKELIAYTKFSQSDLCNTWAATFGPFNPALKNQKHADWLR
jgi:hypothetical protein